MAKYTLLDMTQNILSSLSSDEVNSISDTPESLQVATIIKQKYYDIVSRLDLPNHQQLCQLNPSLDETIPVLMYVPDEISEIKWLKYFDSNVLDGNSSDDFEHDLNVDLTPTAGQQTAPPGYQYVSLIPNDEFIDMVTSFNPFDTNISTYILSDVSNNIDGDFKFYYKNDRQPMYATIISNLYVLFDSFDNTQDSTLQSSKTMVLGNIIPSFEMVDSFIPNLAPENFPLLLNEAKELAFYELRQQGHPLADREVKRGWSYVQKKKAVVNRPTYFDELPGFGRKKGYYGYRGGFTSSSNTINNARGGLF